MIFDKIINNDRTLYDLCRKYKHFYKQYHEIRKVNQQFYNPHLQKAYQESEMELNGILIEILHFLLKNTGALESVKIIKGEPSFIESMNGRIPIMKPASETIVYGTEFAELMHHLLMLKKERIING